MDDAEMLGLGISRSGKNYLVDVRGFTKKSYEGASWKRTLAKMVQDRVVFDAAAGKELLEKKGDPIVYDVVNLWKFIPKIGEISAKVKVACDITIINYGLISTSQVGELFNTYGHDHETSVGEIYSILAGKASIIMYLPGSNRTRVVRMKKGDEFYIPPGWVHRTYCGDEGTVLVGFVPYEAGHRYETVKGLGFPYHIFYNEKAGETIYKRNPRFSEAALEVTDARGSLGSVRKFFSDPAAVRKMLEKQE